MRDQLLAAITARVHRIAVTGDHALALEPGALDDAQRLASILRGNDGDVEARFMLGWFYWYRYLTLPKGQGSDAVGEAIQALTLCFIAGVEELPEPLLPLLVENAASAAVTLLQQALTTSDRILTTAAVSVWRRIFNATQTTILTRPCTCPT